MHYKNVAPSHLPTFLLPCSHCGHRMEITAVAPALYANGAVSNELEDITHTCVQCGATLISTRPFFDDAHAIAHRSDFRASLSAACPGEFSPATTTEASATQ
jgi:hypothetical protein